MLTGFPGVMGLPLNEPINLQGSFETNEEGWIIDRFGVDNNQANYIHYSAQPEYARTGNGVLRIFTINIPFAIVKTLPFIRFDITLETGIWAYTSSGNNSLFAFEVKIGSANWITLYQAYATGDYTLFSGKFEALGDEICQIRLRNVNGVGDSYVDDWYIHSED